MHSPLVERLGTAFFRRAPTAPGVYLMRDQRGGLLYIGKAGNLRQRLNTYRYPARASRKTVRLLHAVAQVEWEICPSELAARLRENELLRTHRPKFNRVGTWPRAYRFVHLRPLADGFELELTTDLEATVAGQNPPGSGRGAVLAQPNPDTDTASGATFGAFKAGVTRAFPALLRLLWTAMHRAPSPDACPRSLLLDRPPAAYRFRHPEAAQWLPGVGRFLAGQDDGLLLVLANRLAAPPTSPFQRQWQQADLERLQDFYRRGPQRNLALCRQFHRESPLIAQEELDDWLAQAPARWAVYPAAGLAASLGPRGTQDGNG